MNRYGIETHWGGRGTVTYVVGMYNNLEEARESAKKGYKWYKGDDESTKLMRIAL